MTSPASTPATPQGVATEPLGPLAHYEQGILDRIADFKDPRQEWRRIFSELLGTFFLVLVAAGGGMMGHAFPGVISRTAAVVAPALMVMAIILFMGKISGAHLNPAVSHRLRAAPGLPVAAGPRLHRGPAGRRRPWPPCSCTPSSTSPRRYGSNYPAARLLGRGPRSGWSSS